MENKGSDVVGGREITLFGVIWCERETNQEARSARRGSQTPSRKKKSKEIGMKRDPVLLVTKVL